MKKKTQSRIAAGIAVAIGLSLAIYAYMTTHYFSANDLDRKPYPMRRIDLDLPQPKDGIEYYGKVQMKVFIDSKGAVDHVEVVDAKVPAAFRDIATNAFAQTRWEPGVKWGLRVNSVKVVEIDIEPPAGAAGRSVTPPVP